MNINTDDEALMELYVNGSSSDKRYKKLPKEVIKGFQKAVAYMIAANRIEDLFRIRGLNYEKLKGDRKGQESVRCNKSWRLIFHSSSLDNSIIITEIQLIEISHHYD